MAQYQKKPVTIEAVKWDGNQISETPQWIIDALQKKEPGKPGHIFRYGNAIQVCTANGPVWANKGDYIVRTIDGDIYPCTPELFEKTHTPIATISITSSDSDRTHNIPVNLFPHTSYVEKLIQTQNEIGYVNGPVNIIALLGLFGEAGEVLQETNPKNEHVESTFFQAVNIASTIDRMKKQIRDLKINVGGVHVENLEAFDSELADCFYYLNALCINRGLTLEDLAQMNLEKIKAKNLQKDISHGTK